MTVQRNPRSVCSRIGLALFAMLGIWIVGLMFATTLAAAISPGSMSNVWLTWLLNDTTLYLIGAPVYLLILHFVPNGPLVQRPQRKPFGVGKYLMLIVFCLGAMYLLGFVSNFITVFAEMLKDRPVINALEDSAELSVWSTILFAVIVPAVGEEFLFRYMIYKKMRGAGDKNYILLSALAFSVFHMNIGQMLYAFAVGLALAWLYTRTGKIWLCMIAHFIINLFGMVLVMELYNISVILYLVFLAMAIIGAIVVFAVSLRQVLRGLAPPTEPGWPQKAPAGPLPWAMAAPAMAGAYGYAPPYGMQAYAQPWGGYGGPGYVPQPGPGYAQPAVVSPPAPPISAASAAANPVPPPAERAQAPAAAPHKPYVYKSGGPEPLAFTVPGPPLAEALPAQNRQEPPRPPAYIVPPAAPPQTPAGHVPQGQPPSVGAGAQPYGAPAYAPPVYGQPAYAVPPMYNQPMVGQPAWPPPAYAATGQPVPAYHSPGGGYPYGGPPAAPGWPAYPPAYAAWQPTHRINKGVLFGNVGMVLYLVLGFAMVLLNLLL